MNGDVSSSEPDKECSRLGVGSAFGNGQRHLLGTGAAHCRALYQDTGDQAFSVKAGTRQYFSSFLLPEPGKFSPVLTHSMESFNLSNLNEVKKKKKREGNL